MPRVRRYATTVPMPGAERSKRKKLEVIQVGPVRGPDAVPGSPKAPGSQRLRHDEAVRESHAISVNVAAAANSSSVVVR